MFYIFFSIIWLLITFPAVQPIISTIITGEGDIIGALIASIFPIIGIVILVIGVMEVRRNLKTSKFGEECFGKILDIDSTGIRQNNRTVYKAIVQVYVESEDRVEIVEEKIGYDRYRFPIYSYVKVKYYNGDINFVTTVSEDNVPIIIKNTIDKNTENIYESNDTSKENYNFSNTETIHQNINGKFEFEFGIIWNSIMILFTCMLFFSEELPNLFVILLFTLFWVLGIKILKNGIRKMKADKKTEEFGENCYGIIYKLSPIGSSNGASYYEAKIVVYVPSEGTTKIISEDIGYDYNKFPEGSYLNLKYYENDVNIKQVVDADFIPEKIRNRITQLRDEKIEEEALEKAEMENYYKNVEEYNMSTYNLHKNKYSSSKKNKKSDDDDPIKNM